MRVLAIATPRFALPTLEELAAASDVELTALLTNPDRPRGRGLAPAPPAAKEWAQERALPVYQPEKLTREEVGAFADLDLGVEAVVVVASAFFVPRWLRERPPLGAVNLHPSLLPALRGAAPINWAIINGLAVTGVTTMFLAQEIDAGDILLQREIPLRTRETAGTLAPRLAQVGAELVLATLRGLEGGTVKPRPQEATHVTHAPKITAETRAVDWARPAEALDRLVRGLYPDFPARATVGGDFVQLLEAEPAAGKRGAAPGTVVAVEREGLIVACGEGALRLLRVKPAGRQDMTGRAFAVGRRLTPGDRLA
ncbi:MAG: methionyl-tRNA formyltransferase [Candidatus Coatesbacteria bacterium]|nr:MAG: methionyl-tRNA formyltransferase [Candidatus Coatesbacteria bacterium]